MKPRKKEDLSVLQTVCWVGGLVMMVTCIILMTTIVCPSMLTASSPVKVIGNNYEEQLTLSDTDISKISDVVFQISGDLSFETQICVTYVILNRLNSPDYPNSVEEVIAELEQSFIRQSSFDSSPSDYEEIIAQAHLDTENAVTCAISMNENVIKLPEDITIMSVDDKAELKEWTSDCVDTIKFYWNP